MTEFMTSAIATATEWLSNSHLFCIATNICALTGFVLIVGLIVCAIRRPYHPVVPPKPKLEAGPAVAPPVAAPTDIEEIVKSRNQAIAREKVTQEQLRAHVLAAERIKGLLEGRIAELSRDLAAAEQATEGYRDSLQEELEELEEALERSQEQRGRMQQERDKARGKLSKRDAANALLKQRNQALERKCGELEAGHRKWAELAKTATKEKERLESEAMETEAVLRKVSVEMDKLEQRMCVGTRKDLEIKRALETALSNLEASIERMVSSAGTHAFA